MRNGLDEKLDWSLIITEKQPALSSHPFLWPMGRAYQFATYRAVVDREDIVSS